MLFIKTKNSKGISLILTMLIMGIILAIGLGLSTIFIREIKMTKEIGDSVVAFYAADTGIEEVLMDWSEGNPLDILETTLDNGAKYEVTVLEGEKTTGGVGEGDCTEANLWYCIKSVGSYQETKRAIEIKY